MRKLLSIFFILFLLTALVACSSDNLEKPAPLVEFKPKIAVTKVWSQSVGGTDDKFVNLAVAQQEGVLYTTSYDGDVYALNAITGKKIWHKKIAIPVISGVAIGQGILVVGTVNGNLLALDAKTGAAVWSQYIGNQVLGLAGIGNNVVVVKTVDDTVIALQVSDGKIIWQNPGDAPQLILRGGSQPQITGNKAMVGFADGKIIALNLQTGAILWQQAIATPEGSFDVQRMIDITASPKLNQGLIFASSYQGNIAALELTRGQVVWSHKLSSYTGLTLQANDLYVTDAESSVWKFQQDNGGVLWQQTALRARNITAPVLCDNYVVVGDGQGYIHWLANDTGEFVAREKLSSKAIHTAPIALGNMVYVLDIAGHLAAYRIN